MGRNGIVATSQPSVRSPCTALQAGGLAVPELQVEVASCACEPVASNKVKPKAASLVPVR